MSIPDGQKGGDNNNAAKANLFLDALTIHESDLKRVNRAVSA